MNNFLKGIDLDKIPLSFQSLEKIKIENIKINKQLSSSFYNSDSNLVSKPNKPILRLI